MSNHRLALAAACLGVALAGAAGASAQALDPVALGRVGATNGALPSAAAVGQALRSIRSGAAASSVSSLGGGALSIDTIGRPPLNDFTAYGGSGMATGSADYTRELAPQDLTRVAAPLPAQGATTLGQGTAAGGGGGGGGRGLNLVPNSSNSSGGGGGGSGGLGAFLPAGAGAALGLGGSFDR